MCGGSIELLPCSHVGHVFRRRAVHSFANSRKNYLRVAEVWLDEYKDHFYEKIGSMRSKEAVVCFLLSIAFFCVYSEAQALLSRGIK